VLLLLINRQRKASNCVWYSGGVVGKRSGKEKGKGEEIKKQMSDQITNRPTRCTYRNEKRSVGRKSCCKRLGVGRGGTTLNEEEDEEEEEEEARKAVVARLHTVDRTGDQEAPISMRALTTWRQAVCVCFVCGSGECESSEGTRGELVFCSRACSGESNK